MDDVAAVPAPVPRDERGERARPGAARERAPRPRPAHELERDRAEHEGRERVRDQARDRRARAEREQHDARQTAPRRPARRSSAEAPQRRPPPGDERADPHQEQQRQPEDAEEEVVVAGRRRSATPQHGLVQDRVGDAPEDRQRRARRGAGCCRGRSPPARRATRAGCVARSSGSRANTSASEPATTTAMKTRNHGPMSLSVNEWIELRIPERVRNVPKIDEEERADHEHDVPDPEHAALLLDHHRVQERRRGEPGHQRGVLDRIPGVIAAPADLLVGPVGAEQLADAERRPGDERPAPGRDDPALVRAPREQRAHGERERHRQPDVAEVEHRRVGHHVRVLQARVQARPVGGRGLHRERRRDPTRRNAKKTATAPSTGTTQAIRSRAVRRLQEHGSGE